MERTWQVEETKKPRDRWDRERDGKQLEALPVEYEMI